MNIKESINLLEWANPNKLYIETYNECDYHSIYTAIETLLTAYEKEKEKNKSIIYNIETVFSEFNDDIELLARCLCKQGLIKRTETEYINPIKDDDNYLDTKRIEIVED